MEATSPEAIKKSLRVYLMVFGALMALTIITVAVSSLHLSIVGAVVVALFVAGIKASLVAGYFMHLISERKMIYAMLMLTAVFFVALMMLPVWHHADPVNY